MVVAGSHIRHCHPDHPAVAVHRPAYRYGGRYRLPLPLVRPAVRVPQGDLDIVRPRLQRRQLQPVGINPRYRLPVDAQQTVILPVKGKAVGADLQVIAAQRVRMRGQLQGHRRGGGGRLRRGGGGSPIRDCYFNGSLQRRAVDGQGVVLVVVQVHPDLVRPRRQVGNIVIGAIDAGEFFAVGVDMGVADAGPGRQVHFLRRPLPVFGDNADVQTAGRVHFGRQLRVDRRPQFYGAASHPRHMAMAAAILARRVKSDGKTAGGVGDELHGGRRRRCQLPLQAVAVKMDGAGLVAFNLQDQRVPLLRRHRGRSQRPVRQPQRQVALLRRGRAPAGRKNQQEQRAGKDQQSLAKVNGQHKCAPVNRWASRLTPFQEKSRN